MFRSALVIPTLNEEASIGALLAEIPRSAVDQVIVADGGSTDATVRRATMAGAQVLNTEPGYGRACLAGVMAALDADVVVFMDGDGADDPHAIESLLAPIRLGTHDFVIGSRVRGSSERGSLGLHQKIAGVALGGVIQLLYGVRYTDMCAFRAIRRPLLLQLGMSQMTYGWNLEMQMRAAQAGFRILEVPVNNRRRNGGHSKVAGSLRGSTRAAARILKTFATTLSAAEKTSSASRKQL